MTKYNKAAAIGSRGIGEPVPSSYLNATEGLFILGSGMKKAKYLGGFVPDEEHFVESIIYLKNQETAAGRAMPFPDSCMRLASGKDVHLFCGSSDYCTTRVDVNETTIIPKLRVIIGEEMVLNKKTGKPVISRETGQPKMKTISEIQKKVAVPTHANVLTTVQKYIAACKADNYKFDLILFDPPYSDEFDYKYGTAKWNIETGIEDKFIRWLVNECLPLLNQNGIILSKNWRSIRHPKLQFIAGEATLFGGYRRFTMFEAWQYKPMKPMQYSLEFYENTWLKPRGDNLKLVPWFVGTGGISIQEHAMIEKYFNMNRTSNGIVITDKPAERFGNCVPVTMDQFNAMGDSIHDVIIINGCEGLGSSTVKTNILKERVIGGLEWKNYLSPEYLKIMQETSEEEEEEEGNERPSNQMARIVNRVAMDGHIYVKSYFDPNLQFYKLELIDRAVITFDNAGKSDLIHIYHKPVGWSITQEMIEQKEDALDRREKKRQKKEESKKKKEAQVEA